MQTPHTEPHHREASKLNWLRASVLGANDGIVSISSLLVGIAGATDSLNFILLTGVAGTIAASLSMGVGEYVSVSSQRDTEEALLEKEKWELEHRPQEELEELTILYQKKGISRETAERVARELSAHDVLAAHLDIELGIHPEELANPWQAAFASSLSFICGAAIPLIATIFSPGALRVPATFVAVLIALIITGIFSARVSEARSWPVILRNVIGGSLAMSITFGVGRFFGTGTL